jgi:2,3-bisphosphoglycerate-dependent phosphoglycerate mutase
VASPVYLVRHGQSTWNQLRLTQGQTVHPPLTRLGQEQAARAADAVAADVAASGRGVDRLLSSDLIRALQTAVVLGRALDVPVTPELRLREQHLGLLQGRGYDETWAAAEAHDWSDPDLPVAGGESVRDVHSRMSEVLAERAPGEVLVVVSHGDAIRSALAHLAGTPPQEAPWVEVANGSVVRVDDEVTWLS